MPCLAWRWPCLSAASWWSAISSRPWPPRRRKQSWSSFRDAFWRGYFRLEPTFAIYQGRHDFDGKLPDLSEAGLKARADFLKGEIARAQAFDAKAMSKDDAFERDYLVAVAKGDLFWLTDADNPHRNPAFYIDILDPNTYVARNYADAPTRLKALTAFLKQVPGIAKQIRANLKTPMPVSFVNHGVAGFKGLADYYTGDAKVAFAEVKDSALQAQFDAAAAAAAKSMNELGDWLESNRATATTDFALGAARFSRIARRHGDGRHAARSTGSDRRSDLKRNQAGTGRSVQPLCAGPRCDGLHEQDDRSQAARRGPVAAARRQIPALRAFVLAKDLASVPGTEQALVEESPPYKPAEQRLYRSARAV